MSGPLEEVNRSIRDLAGRVDAQDDSSTWEFLCECGEDDCREHVNLRLARYDELEDADASVLAPGHPQRRAP